MRYHIWFLALLVWATPVVAQEPGITIKTVELKEKPFSDAKTLQTIQEKTPLQIIRRKGGWYQVETGDKKTGWVGMLGIRKGTSIQTKKGSSGVGSLFKMFRTGSSGTNVATGVRGLDAAQLEGSAANEAERTEMEGFAVSEPEARKFAKSTGLASRELKYLPDPD